MVIWFGFLAPPVPPTPPATQDSTSVSDVPDGSIVGANDPSSMAERAVGLQLSQAIADSLPGQTIVVETPLYTAHLNTRGGTITRFMLSDYERANQRGPVELVDTVGLGAIALEFTTPESHARDTRQLLFQPSTFVDTFRVDDGQASISFSTPINDGQLALIYTFDAQSYEVGLDVETVNPDAFMTMSGYDLIWDGGIPYSEGIAEKEAERSAAYAYSAGTAEYVDLMGEASESKGIRGSVSWVSVKSQYFAAIIIPERPVDEAEITGERIGDVGDIDQWEDYEVRLRQDRPSGVDRYAVFMGPMRYRLLAAYEQNLYDMVDFGWDFFEVVTRPLARFVFIPAFEYLAMFIPNYGVIVILLALLIKLILAPLTASSYRSMAKMKDLAPKMEEIKAKYGNDPKKQQEATMRMYRESGVNPAGGCLPMLLQYPVIIALWQFLPQSIEIRQQGFLWAPDLSAPDAVVNLPFEIPFYGDFISGFTVLMGLSMIVQMKIQSGATASTNPQMKVFMYLFPGMIFVIFNRLASGLSLYYLCFNVLTAAQQMYMNRNNQTAKPPEEAPTQPRRHGKGVSKRASSGTDRRSR